MRGRCVSGHVVLESFPNSVGSLRNGHHIVWFGVKTKACAL